MLTEVASRSFANGQVYMLKTEDQFPLEVTDTFLPFYTKDAIGRKQNKLDTYDIGDRNQRWMIGVSCMSGCPVHCKFCILPGTKILMANGTYTNIEDIVIGDKIIASEHRVKQTLNSKDYATTYGKVTTVLNTFSRHIKDNIFKITLENGKVIECTGNHTIAIKRSHRIEYIRASDLKVGDSALTISDKNYKHTPIWEVGYALGFIAGDGNIHEVSNRNCKRCCVSQSNKELIDFVREILIKQGIKTSNIWENKTAYETDKINYEFSIGQQMIDRLKILYDAYKIEDDFKIGFIAGLYDTEGFSFSNNTTVRICNGNLDLLEYTKRLLLELNIGQNHRIEKYSSSSMYILETDISRRTAKQIFGFRHSKSVYRLNKDFQHERLFKISNIADISVTMMDTDVFNLETEEHNYIAGDIVVHNCATGKLKKWRNLTGQEIFDQVKFILDKHINVWDPYNSKEFKINYTRMGEPFLNIEAVKEAIRLVDEYLPGLRVHHYISTIGIQGSDFSWIKDNITLQVSLHSVDEARRNELIPINNKMTIEELGKIRTQSSLKTTLNMTLVDEADFDIEVLKRYFDPACFFVKLSPINPNDVSENNHMGKGIIDGVNLV